MRSLVLTSMFAMICLAAIPAAHATASTDPKTAPSGLYVLDPSHTSITFKISHLGYSHFTGRFNKVAGTLDYDSAAPQKSSLDITVAMDSGDANNSKLNGELASAMFFDAPHYPQATFHATQIEITGPTTGKVIGDLTLKGMTRRITLDASFVGCGPNPFNKKADIGFSATTKIRRSDFGITSLLPMVGDDVTLQIEAEFDK